MQISALPLRPKFGLGFIYEKSETTKENGAPGGRAALRHLRESQIADVFLMFRGAHIGRAGKAGPEDGDRKWFRHWRRCCFYSPAKRGKKLRKRWVSFDCSTLDD
jgi:hypothetical protein